MAEVEVVNTEETAAGAAGKETMGLKYKTNESTKGKTLAGPTDLPQDYLPFSPRSLEKTTKDSPAGVCPTVDAHTWVSPNKSDEVPLSKESSPDAEPVQAIIREKKTSSKQPNAKVPTPTIKTHLEAADFEGQLDLDLSIVGEGLENRNNNAPCATNGTIFSASSKDFVKIIHGGKEIIMVLPSEASCELSSTLELSETLAASLGITDAIVGLKTTALLLDDDSFKHHGDVVIPFSSLASGQLSASLRRDENGLEGIPSFNLVTSTFDSHIEQYQGEEEEDCQSEESSSISVEEGVLYTEAFVKLMEQSEDSDFTPFEKNSLLRFGIDTSEQASILFQASFRVAVYMGDMKYFVQGLKAIAEILLSVKTSSLAASTVIGCKVTNTKQSSMTIVGLTDFVVAADELFDSSDVTAQQYVTLLNALFSGHPSVQSLVDLYHNPDFLLACDSDENVCQSLCMRDLLYLGKKLELLRPQSSTHPQTHNEDLLNWAIKTGIHNFAASMTTEVPREFVNIIYHMFSSGDEMVLAACQRFVDMDDSDPVDEMLRREWDIFCRNKASREESSGDVSSQFPTESTGYVLESPAGENFSNKQTPNILQTAVNCLEDQQELSEEKGLAILTSYAKGNQLLRDIYDHFMKFGDVDDFLNMLKGVADVDLSSEPEQVAVNDDDRLGISRVVTTMASNAKKNNGDDFQNFFKEHVPAFGQLEIAARRLASTKKDPQLAKALVDFRDGNADSSLFQKTLLNVVENVIQEDDAR